MPTPTDILNESIETHEQKNDDYGAAWRRGGEMLSLLADEPITLETEEDYISLGLFIRRLDKIARAFNGEFLADDLNYESVTDSHSDEATYGAMHASLLAEQENPDPIEFLMDGGESVCDTELSFTFEAQTDDEADDSRDGQEGGEDEQPVDPRYEAKFQELTA